SHTTTGCGKQGFPSAQPYLSHTPGANPFCCMFFVPFLLAVLSKGCRLARPVHCIKKRAHCGERDAPVHYVVRWYGSGGRDNE
ncbi:hypothetical protein BO95DRAFT_351776, partial [Aspergillus brunneoviolaceus CBS 621.78]